MGHVCLSVDRMLHREEKALLLLPAFELTTHAQTL